MLEPDVRWLGRTDRLRDRRARPVQVTLQLLQRHVAVQGHFVADEHAHDVGMRARELDRLRELLLIGIAMVIDPGAHGDIDAAPAGELRHIIERTLDAVGAHRVDFAGEQAQVRVDFPLGGHQVMGGVLAETEGRERETLDVRRPRRLSRRPVEPRPQGAGQRCEGRRNHETGQESQTLSCCHKLRTPSPGAPDCQSEAERTLSGQRCRCAATRRSPRPYIRHRLPRLCRRQAPGLSAAAQWRSCPVSARTPCGHRAAGD